VVSLTSLLRFAAIALAIGNAGGFAVAIAAEPKESPCNDDAMIVFDASGSMAGNVGQGIATTIPRIDEARHALAEVLPSATKFRRVGLVTYGPGPYQQCNVHLDLKPTNLMLDFNGSSSVPNAYILDLGLASLVRETVDSRLDRQKGAPRLVRAGAGTPGWMAPEQIRRAAPHYGPATDLYALGSILYHLLSGREPFSGTIEEILEGHKNQPLPDFIPPANAPADTKAFVRTLMATRVRSAPPRRRC